jgi:hypothetical protein
MLSSINACLFIAWVPAALFPRFAPNLMHIRCRIYREIYTRLHIKGL